MTTKPTTWSPNAQDAPEKVLKKLAGRLFATVTETSVVLSYDKSGRTIRRAIEAGEIPAVRAGSTYRVPTAWIRDQLNLAASPAGAESDSAAVSARG